MKKLLFLIISLFFLGLISVSAICCDPHGCYPGKNVCCCPEENPDCEDEEKIGYVGCIAKIDPLSEGYDYFCSDVFLPELTGHSCLICECSSLEDCSWNYDFTFCSEGDCFVNWYEEGVPSKVSCASEYCREGYIMGGIDCEEDCKLCIDENPEFPETSTERWIRNRENDCDCDCEVDDCSLNLENVMCCITLDVCSADTDRDGVCDLEDNCPLDENSGQEDDDKDGIGDECEGSGLCETERIDNPKLCCGNYGAKPESGAIFYGYTTDCGKSLEGCWSGCVSTDLKYTYEVGPCGDDGIRIVKEIEIDTGIVKTVFKEKCIPFPLIPFYNSINVIITVLILVLFYYYREE